MSHAVWGEHESGWFMEGSVAVVLEMEIAEVGSQFSEPWLLILMLTILRRGNHLVPLCAMWECARMIPSGVL